MPEKRDYRYLPTQVPGRRATGLRRVAAGQAVNQYGHAENSRCARLRRDLLVRIWVIARPMPRNNRAISKGVDPFLSRIFHQSGKWGGTASAAVSRTNRATRQMRWRQSRRGIWGSTAGQVNL